ncbi:MAG: DUF2971 domain-containing protein [Zoogloea sp.]|nr:DUF2971 domain-containing protein [Zoogloea sp.]
MTLSWTSAEYGKVERIFFPELERRKQDFIKNGVKFAYYTSADVAKSILENKKIWMRNIQTMNDPSEFIYGEKLFGRLKGSPVWKRFENALNSIRPLQASQTMFIFDTWASLMKTATFITCFSEHDKEEDQNGRLSMWRAYGGRNGVALIFKAGAMSLENESLAVQAMPVSYLSEDKFIESFTKIVDKLEINVAQHGINNNVFAFLVARFLRLLLLCTKHPGFHEEREWRVIAQPAEKCTDFIERNIEIVRGTPQVVYKMIMKEQPAKGIKDIDLHKLLEKIIIGPCDFPEISRDALLELMDHAGVQGKDERIVVSGIPLRYF